MNRKLDLTCLSYLVLNLILIILFVTMFCCVAHPVYGETLITIDSCSATAPFTGNVSAVALWHHKDPNNPTQYWGWYMSGGPIIVGQTASVSPQGHPAYIVIAFSNGPQYAEVECGQHPTVIFRDGFESGDLSGWNTEE